MAPLCRATMFVGSRPFPSCARVISTGEGKLSPRRCSSCRSVFRPHPQSLHVTPGGGAPVSRWGEGRGWGGVGLRWLGREPGSFKLSLWPALTVQHLTTAERGTQS